MPKLAHLIGASKPHKASFILFISGGIFFGLAWGRVFAQDSDFGVAMELPIVTENIQPGSLICSSTEGFDLCQEEYTPALYGVYTNIPAAGIEYETSQGKLVVRDGIAQVSVVGTDTPIETGDWLTSSDQPGLAQKAVKNGYVLGTALEPFEGGAGEQGVVRVVLNIHPETTLANARSNLFETLRSGVTSPVLEPLNSLRYLLAAALIAASVVLGLLFFGRMSRASIEAIGRNPLAKRDIQFATFVHMVITSAVIGAGLFAAYIVLVI